VLNINITSNHSTVHINLYNNTANNTTRIRPSPSIVRVLDETDKGSPSRSSQKRIMLMDEEMESQDDDVAQCKVSSNSMYRLTHGQSVEDDEDYADEDDDLLLNEQMIVNLDNVSSEDSIVEIRRGFKKTTIFSQPFSNRVARKRSISKQ